MQTSCKSNTSLITIAFILLVYSCGTKGEVGCDEQLSIVESLVESHPDSAAAILDSIIIHKIEGNESAYLTYLIAKAQMGMYNYPAAMESLLRAEKLAGAEGRDSLLALSRVAMMELSAMIYDFDGYAQYSVKACEAYNRIKDYDGMYDVLSQFQGRLYMSLHEHVPTCAREIVKYAKILNDNDTTCQIFYRDIPERRGEYIYDHLKDIGTTNIAIEQAAEEMNVFYIPDFLDVIKNGGEWREIVVNDSTYISAISAKAIVNGLREEGYEHESYEFMDFYCKNYIDKLVRYTPDPVTYILYGHVVGRNFDGRKEEFHSLFQDDVRSVVTRFHYGEETVNKQTIHYQRVILIIVSVLTVAITAVLILWYRLASTRLRQREESEMQAAAELRTTLRDLETRHLETLTHLCNTYYENYSEGAVKSKVARETLKAIKEIAEADDFFIRLESMLNSQTDGLTERLRAQIAGIKEADVRLYVCNALGLSIPAICLLLGEKRDVIYTRRLRLRARIQESDAPDKDTFLGKLR